MKICWDTLEKLRFNKEKFIWYSKSRKGYEYKEFCETCKEAFFSRAGQNGKYCCHTCQRRTEDFKRMMSKKLLGRKFSQETLEKMSKAHKGALVSEENKKKLSEARKGAKNYFYGKKHSDEVKKKQSLSRLGKKHTIEHIKKIKASTINLHKGEENPAWRGGVTRKNLCLYTTYSHKISWCESVRRDPEDENILQVKCTYCGKWYRPTQTSLRQRVTALDGRDSGEGRLYCSSACKQLCPIFGKIKYSAEETGGKQLSREVQAQLRQMVFERDNWICIKCKSNESLTCHHLEGIRWEPLESADIAKCVTLCKNCHEEAHKIEGCKKSDMRCKNNDR